MQTDDSGPLRGRRTMLLCLMDRDGQTKAHPKISKKTLAIRDMREGRGADPSIWPSSKAIRDFLPPYIGIRALGGDNRCLPVCRCGTGEASAVSASLKLSIGSGEIFAASRRRAEA